MNMAACGSEKKTRYEAEFLVLFDTITKIVAYTDSKEEFTKYSQLIYDNLKEYHQLYDIYNNYPGINNIKTINDNAGIKPVKVDKRIIDLLLFGKKWYKDTDGKMNIAFGAVLKIWHKYRTEGIEDEANAALPPMDKLKDATKHTEINKVIIDEANSTVFLDDSNMSLDVGAIGKGYATEQVSEIAIKNGFTSGLISVGGNVRAIGNKGVKNELWNLGIQNPDKESDKSVIKIVYLTDLSLVSSGDYERYYIVDGKHYHHIIDPDTLFPSVYFSEVTIICKDSGKADALSTAVFNMPFEKGLKFINDLPDTEALWVMKNGEIKYSENFKKFIKE
ncbi:MAG TPA: FAD:protein FMN transferase [Ruminiclostridium sp.]